jgi:hypothetical protein
VVETTTIKISMKQLILNLTLGLAIFGAACPALAQTSLVAGWNMYTPPTRLGQTYFRLLLQ